MKVIRVSKRTKALEQLLQSACRETVIFEASDGRLFVLKEMEGWRGFKVGSDLTKNKELMAFLNERAAASQSERDIPLDQVYSDLGLAPRTARRGRSKPKPTRNGAS